MASLAARKTVSTVLRARNKAPESLNGLSAGDLRRRRFSLGELEFVRGENEELFARLKKSGDHVIRTGVNQARPVFIRQFSRGPAAY